MSSFEWMELQTLTSDINTSRSRLAQARSNKDHRLIRVLETEIATAEGRRDRLLSYISTHLAGSPEPTAAAAPPGPPGEPPPVETVEPSGGGETSTGATALAPSVAPSVARSVARSMEGDIVVWEQLTPSDIEQAQKQIGVHRTEMLARHNEELKALEADQHELESLDQAVQAFVRRFKAAPEAGAGAGPEAGAGAGAGAGVVKLAPERELRAQGRG